MLADFLEQLFKTFFYQPGGFGIKVATLSASLVAEVVKCPHDFICVSREVDIGLVMPFSKIDIACES